MQNFFEYVPDEIKLTIFKHVSIKDLSNLSKVCRKFSFLTNKSSAEYESICKKIKSDPNFQPSISNKELFNLVIDEQGNPRYSRRKDALALKPSIIRTELGKLFQIKIATKGCIDANSDCPVWHIKSFVIIVRKDGGVSIYNQKEDQTPDLTQPLTHLTYEGFLNRECLHNQLHQKTA